jgi:Phosphomannomutase
MLTALQLLQVVKSSGKSLKELASDVKTYPQELVNITVADKQAAMDNPALKAVIADVEKEMNGDGRVLVRPSGTEPLLRSWLKRQPKNWSMPMLKKCGSCPPRA